MLFSELVTIEGIDMVKVKVLQRILCFRQKPSTLKVGFHSKSVIQYQEAERPHEDSQADRDHGCRILSHVPSLYQRVEAAAGRCVGKNSLLVCPERGRGDIREKQRDDTGYMYQSSETLPAHQTHHL